MIKKIKETDEKRRVLLGEEAYRCSLADVIARYGNETEKEEWQGIYTHLRQLLEDIARVNEGNQQLLQQSLSFTQYMIEQMLPKSESTGTYQPAVAKETGHSVRLFDAKA